MAKPRSIQYGLRPPHRGDKGLTNRPYGYYIKPGKSKKVIQAIDDKLDDLLESIQKKSKKWMKK